MWLLTTLGLWTLLCASDTVASVLVEAHERRLDERALVMDGKSRGEVRRLVKMNRTKFRRDGRPVPFHGLTCIAWLPEPLQRRIVSFQHQLRQELDEAVRTARNPFVSRKPVFAWVDSASLHMTLVDIDPSGPFDAQTPVSPEQRRRRRADVSAAVEGLAEVRPLQGDVAGLGFGKSIALLVHFGESDLEFIRDLEMAMSEQTGRENPREFSGHITLAYLTNLPRTASDDILAILSTYETADLGALNIANFDLAGFTDMNHYSPVMTVDLNGQ